MFHTVLTADLPSEETAGSAPNDDGLSQVHERVTYSPARLLRTLQQVFEQAEVRDLAYLVIDGRTLYVDAEESDGHDLDRLLTAARDEGYLNTEFDSVRLGLSHWQDGIRHLIDVRVLTAVPVGEHELTIFVSSHVDDLNARRLDDARKYHGRLQEYLLDTPQIVAWRDQVEQFVTRIDTALRRMLFRRTVNLGRTNFVILRPRVEDMVSLAEVAFGASIRPPRYRISPDVNLPPAPGSDPFCLVWEDPFALFRHWAVLDTVMTKGALRLEWVRVTEPDGRLLFEGHKARWFESWPWAKKFSVTFVDEAGIHVELV